ncbi:hypothetical protein VaNZ11_000329 [Volvox africanus]|uniref:U-box domain-containing protein n=1 Tax=Volvox africanus TaxID=51714 RepID=A0ABQ5RMD5_9CHLO|nr:hypothetical protein VaNZ11_000329 [Volvox africanus]
MADILGLILSISEICSLAANKVQDVIDIETDCKELNVLLRRLRQLLDDAVAELDDRQLNKASAIEALEALNETMQLCLDVVTDLSKKSRLRKFFRSGDHVASIKSVTSRISRDLSTLNTALGMEQHADLKRATKKLQIDLENVSLKVMRGFQAQAAQLQEQFERVREELRAAGLTSTPAMDERVQVALLSNLKAAGILDSTKSVSPKEADEVCAAFREEMESMRCEKHAMRDGYLTQLMEAFSIAAKSSHGRGSGTSAPRVHSAQAAELELPGDYRCPITLRVMSDPVKLVESGHSFERAAIERHLATSCTNPLTLLPLSSKSVVPDIALRNAIDFWLDTRGLTREHLDAEAEVSMGAAPRQCQQEEALGQLEQKEPAKLKRLGKGHERARERVGGSGGGIRSLSATAHERGGGGRPQHELQPHTILQVAPGARAEVSFTSGSAMATKEGHEEGNRVKGLCAAALRHLGGLLPDMKRKDCGRAKGESIKGARGKDTRHSNSAGASGSRGNGSSSTGGNRDAARGPLDKIQAHPRRKCGPVQLGRGCVKEVSDSSGDDVLPDSSSSDDEVLPDSSSNAGDELADTSSEAPSDASEHRPSDADD